MSTVANCPDITTCPGVPHEWTPEPTVIHNPRLCLREPRSAWNPVTTAPGCDWCGECQWCQRPPCTCGHYHDPDTACVPECGCRP